MKTKRKKDATAKPKGEKVLVLRTCDKNRRGYAGFQWPESGLVEAPVKWWGGDDQAPDRLILGWKEDIECGGGLHGLLWGEGNGELLNWDVDAKWLVIEVDEADMHKGSEKVRFKKGTVVLCGDRLSATEFVRENGGIGRVISGGTATAGDSGTATAGYGGTATAGAGGTATAGDSGTATAGYRGTATAGYRGTATAGDSGTATAGYGGTATAGAGGTATAGDSGTATAGAGGTATAGYRGTATAGYSGTATAGYSGTVCVRYWDSNAQRYRLAIGYVGEDGIKPNTKYGVENGKLVERKP